MSAVFAAGATSKRILLAVGLIVLLASPAVLLWANRPQRLGIPEDESRIETVLRREDARFIRNNSLPRGFPPNPEFAPFGRRIDPRILESPAAKGMLRTNLGHVPWEVERDDLRAQMPASLLTVRGDLSRSIGGHLLPGLNYIQLSAEAIESIGLDAVVQSVRSHATIVGHQPGSTLIVHVEPEQVRALGQNPNIARRRPYEPYNKIALDLGVRPFIIEPRQVMKEKRCRFGRIRKPSGGPGRDGGRRLDRGDSSLTHLE